MKRIKKYRTRNRYTFIVVINGTNDFFRNVSNDRVSQSSGKIFSTSLQLRQNRLNYTQKKKHIYTIIITVCKRYQSFLVQCKKLLHVFTIKKNMSTVGLYSRAVIYLKKNFFFHISLQNRTVNDLIIQSFGFASFPKKKKKKCRIFLITNRPRILANK